MTCSGTRMAATPWPPSEGLRGWEREGEVGRERGVELKAEGERNNGQEGEKDHAIHIKERGRED